MAGVLALLTFILVGRNRTTFGQDIDTNVTAVSVLLLMAFMAVANFHGNAIAHRGLFLAASLLQLCAAILIALAFLGKRRETPAPVFIYIPLIVISIIGAKALMILSAPAPGIDVFHLVTRAGNNLIHGVNPYDFTYDLRQSCGCLFDHFNYLPMAFIAPLPFRLFLGDVRFAYVAFELISAWGLFILAKRFLPESAAATCYAIPLIMLVNPIHSFILESAWVEPIMVMFLVLFAVMFSDEKHHKYGAIFVGLLLATKQYAFLCLPLLFRLRRFSWQHWLITAATTAVIVVPFYLWSPVDFMGDLFGYYVKYEPRYDAVTFISMIRNEFYDLELWVRGLVNNLYLAYSLVALPAAIFFAFTFWRQGETLSEYFVAFSYLLLAFFMFSKMGFANYDYLIGAMLLIAAAASPPKALPQQEMSS